MIVEIGDFTLNIIASEEQWVFITFFFFCALGFLNGCLFRNIGVLKIIALFFLLPYSLDILIALNRIWGATLPFLICVWLGWYGFERTWQKAQDIYRVFR